MPEETISCSLPEFERQVASYDRLALLVVGQHSEAAERFAENLSLSELNLDTAVLVAEGQCQELVSNHLKVKQTPSVVVLERGVKKGEVAISGDFDKDVARLKELCAK